MRNTKNIMLEATDWPHMEAAQKSARILKSAGYEAYIIGGAVRDLLLGIAPKDFDIATDARPEQISRLEGFSSADYQDTSQAYGVSRVKVEIADRDQKTTREIEMEIATYRRDVDAHLGRKATKVSFSTLEEDIKRRDFTINALALEPDTGQIVDLVGGREDLEDQIIRFIGKPQTRIQEDPLRLLRAIRLRNKLGFDYETKTAKSIHKAAQKGTPQDIAIERLKPEITKILMDSSRSRALEDLDSFSILSQLLPEVAACKEVKQPADLHAEGDVFCHTLLALDYLPDIVSPRLAWATLLHDIGKAETFVPASESGDRIRFDNHYGVGADLADKLLKRLSFGSRFRSEVSWMIHHHLAIDDLPNMRPRRVDNFMHHPAFADLLELHKADAHAAWSRDSEGNIDKRAADFSQLESMWQQFQQRQTEHPPSLKHDLGIDGNWLIKVFRLESGPELARILESLEAAYLNHEIHTASEAKQLAKRLIEKSE